MPVSVIKRPLVQSLSPTPQSGTAGNSGGLQITSVAHGLITGDYVYITSLISTYNGFWYVTISDADHFTIAEYSGAVSPSYVVDSSVTFYKSTLKHGYNAIFLPIIYKLQSNLWPTNSLDTARTVSSFSNDNGYVKLTLSGAITSNVTELEYIKITGPNAGIYQILSWFSNSIVTINLVYDSGLVFTSSSVQYYYSDYFIRVRIYAGITSTHPFASVKPYALISEQDFKPDSNGIVIVNINDDIKSKINALINNLVLSTLPNNIDAWCNFYISYSEGYSYSQGGYGLLDFISSFTSDQGNFEGVATNSYLKFKNTYSGAMSDYLFSSNKPLKFLTPSLNPVNFNNYFDVSWINQYGISGISFRKQRYINSVLQGTLYDSIPAYGIGIYRNKIAVVSTEDRVDVSIIQPGQTLAAKTAWSNFGAGTSWTLATPSVVLASGASSKRLVTPFISLPGVSYSFNIQATISVTVIGFIVEFIDSVGNITGFITSQTDSFSGSFSFTPSVLGTQLSVRVINDIGPSSTSTINTFTYTPVDSLISEVKSILIDTSCSQNFIDISWLNYLGGFDYWRFKGNSDLGMNIEEVKTTERNILPTWPRSYGSDASTIKRETKRTSRNTVLCRAENLTADQVDDLYRIKASPLIQIVNSPNDRRTILLDADSFVYHSQNNKLFEISFTFEYTDPNPAQSL